MKPNQRPHVLVTGANGFIGSHLVRHLIGKDFQVRAVDKNSLSDLADVQNLDIHVGDLCDRQFLERMVEGVSWIFHLAAQSSVAVSLTHEAETRAINEIATGNLIQSAIQNRVKGLVFSSTSAVYGRPDQLPNSESDAVLPLSPYGWTKLASERLIIEACRSHSNFRAVTLRYFNIYGPGQKASSGAIVPRLVEAALQDQTLEIYGDGTQTRDFIFVDDVIRANVLAFQQIASESVQHEIYNVASGKPVSILDLIQIVESVTGKVLKLDFRPARSGEIQHSFANISKIQKELGFQSETELKVGVRDVYRSLQLSASCSA